MVKRQNILNLNNYQGFLAPRSGFYTKRYDGFGVFGKGEHSGQNNGKKAKLFKFELIIKGFKHVTLDFVQKKLAVRLGLLERQNTRGRMMIKR